MKQRPSQWPLVLTSGLGILILCALGSWQLIRLGEKERMLAELNARATAAPISLSEALSREDNDFIRIEARGVFDHARETRKQAVYDGGPGWEIITPFLSADGVAVLVDRGVIPADLKSREDAPGQVTVSGVIRFHEGRQGIFDPDNDQAGNIWYWWDIPAMQAQASFPADAKIAPFILQALPQAEAPKFPKPGDPGAGIRNNHLQYAITWFSLAIVLLTITIFFARQRRT
jgi:surfeit locus 1 family protein